MRLRRVRCTHLQVIGPHETRKNPTELLTVSVLIMTKVLKAMTVRVVQGRALRIVGPPLDPCQEMVCGRALLRWGGRVGWQVVEYYGYGRYALLSGPYHIGAHYPPHIR